MAEGSARSCPFGPFLSWITSVNRICTATGPHHEELETKRMSLHFQWESHVSGPDAHRSAFMSSTPGQG
ncbi:Uncharacterized protein DAT39_021256 [Clarias magur]|uniref:Uncharacterized protein n=1 Tax=Clarias magur TaxID=1594786 RepID=A0A8J4TD80_CLAMG|nr:Uncharacterized protein DAT39_021256 [Clarias magur]